MLRTRRAAPTLALAALALSALALPHTAQASPNAPPNAKRQPGDARFHTGLAQAHAAGRTMDRAGFAKRYRPAQRVARVSYNALKAKNLKTITRVYTPSPAQRTMLKRNGMVVLDNAMFGDPALAYAQIYHDHQPVFITADSLLYAWHRSYDTALKDLELSALRPELIAMLDELHSALVERAPDLPPAQQAAAQDVDLYLTVARKLLTQAAISPAFGKTTMDRAAPILGGAKVLIPSPLSLFGSSGLYDYSQLKPRGHYTEHPDLETYFQAMMWIGRTELKLVTFQGGRAAEPRLNRKAVESAALLNVLLNSSKARERWDRFDRAIMAMIGEHDSMTPPQMDAFMRGVGATDMKALAKVSDAELLRGLMSSPFGTQRIMSQMIKSPMGSTEPVALPRIYQLMGQRFVLDSHVFHQLTYDRLMSPGGSKLFRMMPSPLDVMFALGSNTAAEVLLEGELKRTPYQHALHTTRYMVEAYPGDFWQGSLYNGWTHAIRGLNDTTYRARLPESMRTKAWDRKTLNTQLASWAELKHNNLLYTKQSYGAMTTCEYPDAQVEPVPEFYRRMNALAQRGRAVAIALERDGYKTGRMSAYFKNMGATMETLEQIALKQLRRQRLTKGEVHFLKTTIEREAAGCGPVRYDGWYAGLFYDRDDIADYKPIIADVHTAPEDPERQATGGVLHVGTGKHQLMVVTVGHGKTSHAYVGPVSSYYEHITRDFQRLNDAQWKGILGGKDAPQRPKWTDTFLR